MRAAQQRWRRAVGVAAAAALVVVGLVTVPTSATAAAQVWEDPTVTADALPTVQIDGVVWSQVIVGNRVFVAGEFTTARPAGSAAGVNTTPRANILAYDLTTGELITTWAPTLNGPAYAIAASPDGSRIYVGGDFTRVNNTGRNRFAVLNASTGALVSGWTGGANAAVRTIVATASTVYVGGNFNTVAGQSRPRVAAFNAVQRCDHDVARVGPAPAGGRDRAELQRVPAVHRRPVRLHQRGGALGHRRRRHVQRGDDLVDREPRRVRLRVRRRHHRAWPPTAPTSTARPSGSSTTSSARATSRGCSRPTPSPPTSPGSTTATATRTRCSPTPARTTSTSPGTPTCARTSAGSRRSTRAATSTRPRCPRRRSATIQPNSQDGYFSLEGQPAPELRTFWPTFSTGTFTGTNQATWHVTGNGEYVVYGGEFLRVNGVGQQGLVRFATSDIAPDDIGPSLSGNSLQPTAASYATGTMQVSWPANWDRDDETLTYQILRNGEVVGQVSRESRFWDLPRLSFTDTGLSNNTSYSYRVAAVDDDGNSVTSPQVTATTTGGGTGPLSTYAGGRARRQRGRVLAARGGAAGAPRTGPPGPTGPSAAA